MARDARAMRFASSGWPAALRWARLGPRARVALALAIACALGWGCAERASQTAANPAARAQQLIDAGNAAYHQGDYRLAMRRYAAAAVERKDDPAAYYGMGMALGKLGRDEEARAAYQRARSLAQAGGRPVGSGVDTPSAVHP